MSKREKFEAAAAVRRETRPHSVVDVVRRIEAPPPEGEAGCVRVALAQNGLVYDLDRAGDVVRVRAARPSPQGVAPEMQPEVVATPVVMDSLGIARPAALACGAGFERAKRGVGPSLPGPEIRYRRAAATVASESQTEPVADVLAAWRPTDGTAAPSVDPRGAASVQHVASSFEAWRGDVTALDAQTMAELSGHGVPSLPGDQVATADRANAVGTTGVLSDCERCAK